MNNSQKLKLALVVFVTLALTAVPLGNTISYAQETETQQEEETSTQSASLESIKKIIKDNLSSGAVRGAIDNLLNRKVAMYGEVNRVTDETITITSRLGTRIVPINEVLTVSRDEKPIQTSEIAVENWVTILGRIKDDNFSPVFLYLYSESLLPKPQYVDIGTITEITRNTITISPRSGEEEKTIKILTSTDFEDIDGVEITLNDLSKDITVLVSGNTTESDDIDALTVRSLATMAESDE